MIIKGKRIKLALPERCDGLALVALRGSLTSDSKLRIYSCFVSKGVVEGRMLVKKEYCNCGFSGSPKYIKERNYLFKMDCFKGIKYSYFDELGRIREGESNHRNLADKIQELIDKGEYLTERELAIGRAKHEI